MEILFSRFRKIDEENNGNLEPERIFNVNELEQNPLVKRIIESFDRNKNKKISFS